jgi:cytochrome P450
VRISPNHLSFTDVRAWKDIYGQRPTGDGRATELPKLEAMYRTNKQLPTSIINAEHDEHMLFRRALAPGFSDKSMRAQEPIIAGYVDLLIRRLRERCADGEGEAKETELNMMQWYNWTTFDVIGDLVFGKSFGCLDGSSYHPWIPTIMNAIKDGAKITALAYLGFKTLAELIVQTVLMKNGKRHRSNVQELLKARLDRKEERDDLIEGLLKKREEWVRRLFKAASLQETS